MSAEVQMTSQQILSSAFMRQHTGALVVSYHIMKKEIFKGASTIDLVI